MRARILGTGRALPEKVVTNADLERMVDTSDEWIVARTGIRERRVLEEGRTTSDLAAEAAFQALAVAGCPASAVDGIVVATATPDYLMPACAPIVQRKLGATCMAFDVNAACAGFLYALSVGDALVRGGGYRRLLVIGADTLTRLVDWKDRNTCILFGDGAGAVLLGPSDDDSRGILSTHLFSDGEQAESLYVPAGGATRAVTPSAIEERAQFMRMNGRAVFAHAVRNLSRASLVALEHNGRAAADVDWVIAHQANRRILEGVADKCRLPLDRFYLNVDRYGNTSAASVPIVLDEAVRDGSVKPNQLLLLCALGAGFAWGSALVRF